MSKKVSFDRALSLLLKGEVVALPTETVYGLAGRIDKKQTLENIFKLKQRPFFDPLIVHCYDKKQALESYSGDQWLAELLFDFFSPGPLTIVARKNKNISSLITAGKKTVAVRIPKHPLMRKILKKLPTALAAPSANLYGKVSPVQAQHVLSSFPGRIFVLDGGECEGGLESTIIYPDVKKKKIFILRPGMITKERIESFLKRNRIDFLVERKKDHFQPGGQESHYKPSVPLYIFETEKQTKEIKAFLLREHPKLKPKELLLASSPQVVARTLYSQLIKLSKGKNSVIFVRKTKGQSDQLWTAIWDRLKKASSAQIKDRQL